MPSSKVNQASSNYTAQTWAHNHVRAGEVRIALRKHGSGVPGTITLRRLCSVVGSGGERTAYVSDWTHETTSSTGTFLFNQANHVYSLMRNNLHIMRRVSLKRFRWWILELVKSIQPSVLSRDTPSISTNHPRRSLKPLPDRQLAPASSLTTIYS